MHLSKLFFFLVSELNLLIPYMEVSWELGYFLYKLKMVTSTGLRFTHLDSWRRLKC